MAVVALLLGVGTTVVVPKSAGADSVDPPVVRVAGGLTGDVGDGGAAVAAPLNGPSAVAYDASGNLYIADRDYDRVRKVSPDGIITTVAGTGLRGFNGDGGPATEAELYQPYDVEVGVDGSVYIADYGNHRVRRVDPAGIITTVAGNGSTVANGDGIPATEMTISGPIGLALGPAGLLHISDYTLHRVVRVDASGIAHYEVGTGSGAYSGDGGPATAARIRNPRGLDFQADGSLLIADYSNHRVRRVAPDGTISTILGTGSSSHSGDGGPATSAAVPTPTAVAVAPTGEIYVASYGSHRIRVIDPGTGIVTTFTGNGTSGVAPNGTAITGAAVRNPMGVAIDPGGDLVFAAPVNNLVRSTAGGVIRTIAGGPSPGSRIFNGDGPGLSTILSVPRGISISPEGDIVFADAGSNRVRRILPDGRVVTLAGNGSNTYNGSGLPGLATGIYSPYDVAHGPNGTIYLTEVSGNRVRRIESDGTVSLLAGDGVAGFSGDGGPALLGRFASPRGIAVAGDGTVYIADYSNQRIRRIAPDGTLSTFAGTGTAGFSGDGGPAVAAELNNPNDIALGPDGSLYIADLSNNRIRRVTPDGTISTFAGTGLTTWNADDLSALATNLPGPRSISFDSSGQLYVAAGVRIVRIDTNGVAHEFAGTGGSAITPDRTALTTDLGNMEQIAAADGVVLVSDSQRQRIRLIGEPPTAVRALDAQPAATGASAQISWTAPDRTGGLAIGGYEVTVDDPGVAVATSGTGASLTGLVPHHSYVVSVIARTIAGTGPVATVTFTTPNPPVEPGGGTDPTPSAPVEGYRVVTNRGRVIGYGDTQGVPPADGEASVVAAARGGDSGLLLLHSDGRVTTTGDAVWRGDMAGTALDAPMVAMAVTPDGNGYWLLARDGGVFAFGSAGFFGSTGGMRLAAPVVDMAASPDGAGYWLVAEDGGIFAFGDATFRGSAAVLTLDAPIRSMAAAGDGYWLISEDGGVFTYGLPFWGSVRGRFPTVPVDFVPRGVRIRGLGDGGGYLILTVDGVVRPYGRAIALPDPGEVLTPGEFVVDLVL